VTIAIAPFVDTRVRLEVTHGGSAGASPTTRRCAMKKMEDDGRMPLEKKLTLNKETIRVLTDREMMDVEGGTCGNVRSTCADPPTVPLYQCV
jgi:hypothetical protein